MSVYTKNSKSDYRRGWSRIWGKQQGTLLLLPTEATHTIVSLDPFAISCIIPPTKRTVVADYYKRGSGYEVEIDVPQLLIRQQIYLSQSSCGEYNPCSCEYCYRAPHPAICGCHLCEPHREKAKARVYGQREIYRSRFTLNTAKFVDSEIHGSAYRLGNVYTHSQMCFGGQPDPRNLRQANAQFWGSPINNDFGDFVIDHYRCDNKNHRYGRYHFEGVGGCYKTPRECHKQVTHTCVCARLHLDECNCLVNCVCKCECTCCTGGCQCECQCRCCRNICGCPCRCDMNAIFAQLLRDYRPKMAGNLTQYATGKRSGFLTTAQRTDAIFISFDEDLVEQGPTRRLQKLTGVVGFANRLDDVWQVDLGSGVSLELADSEVYIP